MFGISPIKLWIYGAAIAVILGGLTLLHHKIYAEGEAAQLKIDAPKLAADQVLIQAQISALLVTNAQAKANEDAAAEQKTKAGAAVKAAQVNAQEAGKALAAWRTRYSAAIQTPDCAIWAAMKICTEIGGDL